MPLTNFGNGLSSFGVPVLGGGVSPGSGQVFFVDDSSIYDANDGNHGLDPTTPFTTLAYAMTQCTAGHGDVVLVGAGHSESLATMLTAGLTKYTTTVVALKFGTQWVIAPSSSVVGNGTDLVTYRATGTLPQTTTGNIFTIAGGFCLVKQIYGIVTTAIQNQANNTKLTAVATGLTGVDLCAVVDVANAAVGTTFSITGTLANAGVLAANQAAIAQATAIRVGPGVIRVDCAASNTGAIQWNVLYQPLQPGAAMLAA